MTFFTDIAEFQTPYNASYPYPIASARLGDGTRTDNRWQANNDYLRGAVTAGRMVCWQAYYVYRPIDVGTAFDFIRSTVGAPDPRMAFEIDVESWGGQIGGNHSASLNDLLTRLRGWLGPKRVVAYGNSFDLASIWPQRPADLPIRLASYGPRIVTGYPNLIAQQYYGATNDGSPAGFPRSVAPFGGYVDLNYTPLSAVQYATRLGLITPAAPVTPEDELMSMYKDVKTYETRMAAIVKANTKQALAEFFSPTMSDGHTGEGFERVREGVAQTVREMNVATK